MVTRTGGSWTHVYTGLSTDTQATTGGITIPDLAGVKVPNGSKFEALDTMLIYRYDEENDLWRTYSTSDSGQ